MCRLCGAHIPWKGGQGRPRRFCTDKHRKAYGRLTEKRPPYRMHGPQEDRAHG